MPGLVYDELHVCLPSLQTPLSRLSLQSVAVQRSAVHTGQEAGRCCATYTGGSLQLALEGILGMPNT